MKLFLFTLCLLTASCSIGYSQLYSTRTGLIGFFSKTPLEDIKAENSQVYAVIDVEKKNIAFSLLIKGFLFERELQQEHFNENYMESDQFPKATFTGAYTGDVVLAKEGTYNVVVKGKLTIHGVTKDIETPATLQVAAGKLLGRCTVIVKPDDYGIKIPSIVREKIAKEVALNIQIDCNNPK